jgi:hypothetical protein
MVPACPNLHSTTGFVPNGSQALGSSAALMERWWMLHVLKNGDMSTGTVLFALMCMAWWIPCCRVSLTHPTGQVQMFKVSAVRGLLARFGRTGRIAVHQVSTASQSHAHLASQKNFTQTARCLTSVTSTHVHADSAQVQSAQDMLTATDHVAQRPCTIAVEALMFERLFG